MNKYEIEKSLKRYLKKKISYTFSLLVAFLITGGISNAESLTQEELLSRVSSQREKLERLLKDNQREINILQKDNLALLKEADYYTKPAYGSLFALNYFNRQTKSVEKEWKPSVGEATEYDALREDFNSKATSTEITKGRNTLAEAIQYTNKSNNRSSGWLNSNTNYSNNMNAYDVEAKLFILPVVKAPEITTPTAPTVSFTVPTAPTELNISAPSLINVNIGAINVNTPNINVPTVNAPATITAPTMQEVTVNEPNISVAIGAINVAAPTVATVPGLTAPTVTVNMTTAIPSGIEVPNPTVTPPDSPEAPNFTVFVRARGHWLHGSSVAPGSSDIGFNNFNRNVKRWVNGSGATGADVSVNNAPFFAMNGHAIYGDGVDKSEVIATTVGSTITNKYTRIATDFTTNDMYPDNRWYGITTTDPNYLKSDTAFPGVTAGTFYSAEDNNIYGDSKALASNKYSQKYQQDWIFQGAPTIVKKMTIKVGGNQRGTAIFAQTDRVNMEDVDLYLKGKTIIADVDTQGNYLVNFKNVTTNIEGNFNTIIGLSSVVINKHIYSSSMDARPSNLHWGIYRGDLSTNEVGVNLGGRDIVAQTSNNAVYYQVQAYTHRWVGVDFTPTVPNTTINYAGNPGKYLMFYPTPGNIKFENKDIITNTKGKVRFIGSENAGAWIASYVPDRRTFISGTTKPQIIDFGKVELIGDKNVAYYFADSPIAIKSSARGGASANGVFEGEVNVNVEMGKSLDGATGSTQIGTGNMAGGDSTKSEKNVAIYVASGQRNEMNEIRDSFAQFYPATLSFTIDNINLYGTDDMHRIVGITNGDDIGAHQLGTNANIIAKVHNLQLKDFNIVFGKYSQDSIGIVAKNGSVIDLEPISGKVTDNAENGAEKNVLVYAEGVWWNPRFALTAATYDKEAYGRGESVTGQKYISDFNTKVNIKKNVEMGSIKSTAFFAKSGAIIDSTNNTVKMTGYGSTAVLAHSTSDYATGKIVDSYNANANVQPKTEIIVKSVEALAQDSAGTTDGDKNTNIAVAAISEEKIGGITNKGTGNVTVTVKENVKVKGLGAFASGEKAIVKIESANDKSDITSGANGALVATNAGTIDFGGGTITHNVEDKVAFYSEKRKDSGNNDVISHINFKDATTLNISKGIVFYGDKEDYSKTSTVGSDETGRYTGMQNLTVNLKGHGVNLGVFKNADLNWEGNASTKYTDDIALIPKVAAINTSEIISGITTNYWYKSSLEGGKLTVKADVDRDDISSGTTRGDGFNDIQMEREKVVIDDGSVISSKKSKSMLLASNKDAVSNTESGYRIKDGKISISSEDGDNKTTVGTYVNFGHIITEKTTTTEGKIEVNKGVAAYGVNGSKIENSGTIKVGVSSDTEQGIGIMSLARTYPYLYTDPVTKITTTKMDEYGIFAGMATDPNAKWIDIINKGNISITGDNGIGIYSKNNYDDVNVANDKITVYNEGTISVGKKGKAIVMQTENNTVKNGGELTLKDSGLTANNQDIKVGDEGIGVYAEHTDITLDGDYGMAIGNKAVGIQTKGTTSTVIQTGTSDILNVEYKSSSTDNDTSAMAIAYTLDNPITDSYTNKLNLNLINTDNAKALTGIYATEGVKLINQGNITTASKGSYGILSKTVDVENTGEITVGATSSTDSNAVGIYAENAGLTTDGDKIILQANGDSTNTPIGIYAKADSNIGSTVKDIKIEQGSNAMTVTGKKAIAVFLKEDGSTNNNKLKLLNSSNITLSDSANKTDRRIALMLVDAKNTANETSGIIKVGKNNIGILNDSSILTSTGTIEAKHNEAGTENIGVHNTGNNFKFIVKKDGTNPGIIDVEGQDGTIGISAITSGTDSGEIELIDATVNVNAPDKNAGKIPLGIYSDGNNIKVNSIGTTKFTVSPNSVGIYMKGDSTSKVTGAYEFSLSSENTQDRIGIGTFLTGGAYAETTGIDKIKLSSTGTATNTDGPIRPIGLFYGQNSTKNDASFDILSSSKEIIGMYGNNLGSFENNGKINIAAKSSMGAYFAKTDVTNNAETEITDEKSYGWYLKGGVSSTTAKISALAKESVGVLVTGKGITGTTSFENISGVEILTNADKAIGVYAEEGAKYINKGTLNSLHTSSIGAFGVKATLVNDTNATINTKNVGIYGKTSSTIENKGTLNISEDNKTGIIADDKTTVNLTDGKIESTNEKVSGVVAQDKSIINLSGTNIKLGKESIAINSTNNSVVNLTSGNIEVGEKGLGLYTKDGKVDLTAYTDEFTLEKEGIGIYSKDSTLSAGTLKIMYNHSTNDIGVGVYYDGGTVVNDIVVSHTGKNLVNILSNTADLTNNVNQTVEENSIGLYAKGGTLENKSTLTLNGDKSVGVFLDNGSKLTNIGTINGNAAATYKVGVYANNGSIEGTKDYNFTVDNGVAMYLGKDGVNNSTGTLNLSGNSIGTARAIGIYTTPTSTARNINTNINVTGTDAIGLFLSENGINGSDVNYGGTLEITSNSSDSNFGIGALVDKNSTFTLTSSGKVKIGGQNNIGFFVKQGGTLQVSGGTVENTKDGIFAYLSDGQLNFTAGTTPNINFLNTFVSGSLGSIQNATSVTVGTAGLQASQGASILNDTKGTVQGAVEGAKALVGTDIGSIVENKGSIALTGDKSVALYADNGAKAISSGSVEIGKNSVAYYTNRDGKIDVSGTTKIDEGSTVFYVNSGEVNYTGPDIILPNKTAAITLTGSSSTTKIDFNNKNITVGQGGTGIYITKNGETNSLNNTIQNIGKINVKKSANAIYLNNDKDFESNVDIDLIEEESIGVLSTKDGNINYSGNLNSISENVKAMVHRGNGNTVNSGVIKVNGNSSIGAYAENGAILQNNNLIEIGEGTKTATSVGLYGKNQGAIKNFGTIKMVKSSIGIYGENTDISNETSGIIQNSGLNNNGIYAKDSSVTNLGTINLGDSSNGIYANSVTTQTITNSGDIKVGSNQASAIFGDGKAGINNLGGTLTTGSKSVGIATKEGNITVGAATNFNIGDKSTYIYTEKGNAVNNANFNLSKYSVGLYTKEGAMQNTGNITVGESSVANKNISVAMATEKGTIENFGNISVPNKNGVAMVANNGGTAINRSTGTITVGGEAAFGLQATEASTLINEGKIDVNGKDARGMAATQNSIITNTATGIINVNGTNTQGIFVDYGSKVKNDGTININSSTGIGLITGNNGIIDNSSTGKINVNVTGGLDTKTNSGQLSAGSITIKGPKAYIDNVEIQNSGTITINGALNFNEIRLGSTAGNIGTINAKSFNKGKFIVLPNATLGSNKDMYTIQYLGGIQNVPNNGSITAISHSATFVADIQKDDVNPNLIRVVMVRVPYTKITENTAAQEFGKGLDDLYKGLSNKDAQAPEQKIFDALKMISNKEQLGATFDKEMRGNVYANVQRRMLDINEVFAISYENLKSNNLYAKGRLKIGAIVTNGNAKDKNAGVEDYKSKTTGLIIIKEKDFKTYGRIADVSLAFTETNFKFDYGSKEKVHSLQLGVGLENYLNENSIKYITRGEMTLNRHTMKRKIHLSNGTYENKGKYWSETAEWKNKLRYETTTANGLITVGVYGTFNLGYGKFNSVKENGDGAELEIKSNNMYMIRPGVGTDLALNHYTKAGKISIIGSATAEYEAGKVYDGVNQARIKNSSAGYYDLEKPKEVKDVYKFGAQIQYQTNAGHQIGIGVTREEGSIKATRYGVNATYKF